jgi:hypothetical protein
VPLPQDPGPTARTPARTPVRHRGWVVAALLLVGGAARAEGPGSKLGDSLVLHPGIWAAVGYDSNVNYAPENSQSSLNVSPQGSFYVAIRPSLDLATPSLQRGGNEPHALDFRLHLGAPLRFLTNSAYRSSNYNSDSIGMEGGLLLAINPFGHWSFDLYDTFLRTSEPPYAGLIGVQNGIFGDKNIDRDNNVAGLRLRWRPDGQRFESTAQYAFTYDYFEGNSPSVYTSRTSLTNAFTVRFKWKFFPKTALYLNADEQIVSYPGAAPMAGQPSVAAPPTAYPFRVVLGLLGLITSKFTVNINAGYGNSFTQSNASQPAAASYNSVVALADLSWQPTVLTTISLGYRHDFAQALIGTFYNLDSGTLSLSQSVWRFNIGARLIYNHRAYQGDLTGAGLSNGRVDDELLAHLQIDFFIKDWFWASLGDDLMKNWSNCQLSSTSQTISGLPCNYLRNDTWLRLTLAY